MAVFVSMDKSVPVETGIITFISATNGNTYRYRLADAERVFGAHGFDEVDAKSMLEMTAINHQGEDNMLGEDELEAGAAGLVSWKQAEAARQEAEQRRKAEEAARARAEYERAKAAAEEEERRRKAAEDAKAAQAAAAAKKKKKKSSMGFLSRAMAMAEDAAKAAVVAGEAAIHEGQKLYQDRKVHLAALKAAAEKAELASSEGSSGGGANAQGRPLTFYEQALRNAQKAERVGNDYLKMTNSALEKGQKAGDQKFSELQQQREQDNSTIELRVTVSAVNIKEGSVLVAHPESGKQIRVRIPPGAKEGAVVKFRVPRA